MDDIKIIDSVCSQLYFHCHDENEYLLRDTDFDLTMYGLQSHMIKCNADFRSFQKLGVESNTDLQHRKELLADILSKYGESHNNDSNSIDRMIEDKIRNLIGVKIPGFFPTPNNLADYIISEFADLQDNLSILEPSAGFGTIADSIRKFTDENNYSISLDVIELSSSLREILQLKNYSLIGSNFLEFTGKTYDRIIMNPPFEHGQDMDHVYHAFELLNNNGLLISIVSRGVFFRSYKKETEFREFVNSHGYSIVLPDDSFLGHQSFNQTGVKANLVILRK